MISANGAHVTSAISSVRLAVLGGDAGDEVAAGAAARGLVDGEGGDDDDAPAGHPAAHPHSTGHGPPQG